MSTATTREPDEVIWHDAECGGYRGDLELWLRLASERGGPILDLGAGSGRVSLSLAAAGHEVWALDRDPTLLAALSARAAAQGLRVGTVESDCREPAPVGEGQGLRFATIIAPMQLFQLLPTPSDRRSALGAQRQRQRAGDLLTVVLLDGIAELFSGMPEPLPDVRERDGWVFSSTPVTVDTDGRGVTVRRRRERVSPAGELSTTTDEITLYTLTPEMLEREAAAYGYRPLGRELIAPTSEHVGSIAVHLEATDG